MKKIRIFRRYDSYWEIIFAAVTVVALSVYAAVMFSFERELYQVAAIFCVFAVSVLVFAVFNLFHGLRAAIAAFVAFEMMCSSLLLCALSPAVLTAMASSTLYDSPAVEREIFEDKNVMVFVPHQDDEINILAGVFEEYVAAGSTVRIVYMTYGDYYGLADTRVKEAKAVAEFYGISEENLIFFGYGDNWQGTHIYHASDDEVCTSHYGYTATYDAGGVTPYRYENYTRSNLVNDFKSVIEEYMPDTMFVVDYDHHPDHRANGFFFDEAISSVLSETKNYHPVVYKAFAYRTSWEAVKDFYEGDNILSTLSPSWTPYIEDVNCYDWDDRVRFPVANGSLGYLMNGTSMYKAYSLHVSQSGYKQAIRAINSDKVFFRRDTSSLTYGAEITVSSNSDKAYKLNDFKLIDSENISHEYNNDFYAGAWSPSEGDSRKEVTVKFSSASSLSLIRLYDAVSLSDNVLKGTITLSDGTVIPFGNLSKNGSATDVTFDKRNNITGFTVRIDEYEGSGAGFDEIEAYAEAPDCSDDAFIKIEDTAGTFAYEYTMPAEESYFSLYAYECSSDVNEYEISVTGDISAEIEDGKIKVTCERSREGILTVTSKTGDIYDSVKITNPNSFERFKRNILKTVEQNYSFTSRINYYKSLSEFINKKFS